MKIVFVSNYYNHHPQATLAQALYHLSGGKYTFIKSRQKSGRKLEKWGWALHDLLHSVKHSYKSKDARKTCM